MVITGSEILARNIFSPAAPRTHHPETGMTFGAGPAGYDVRIKQALDLYPGQFALASSFEHFNVPRDLVGFVHDKSSLARLGLFLGMGVVESGWRGHLTIEIKNQGYRPIHLLAGQPIAQIVFHLVVNPTQGYDGRYQDQADEPTHAKLAAAYEKVNHDAEYPSEPSRRWLD
jgi:dCTP deaminase